MSSDKVKNETPPFFFLSLNALPVQNDNVNHKELLCVYVHGKVNAYTPTK